MHKELLKIRKLSYFFQKLKAFGFNLLYMTVIDDFLFKKIIANLVYKNFAEDTIKKNILIRFSFFF